MADFSAAPRLFERNGLRFDRADGVRLTVVLRFLDAAPDFESFLDVRDQQGGSLADQLLRRCREKFQNDTMLLYLVGAVGPDAQPLGAILMNASGQGTPCVNLAYYIVPQQRGQGFAPKMIEGFLGEIFEKTAMTEVYCAIWGHNKSSLRTLEKAGFSYLGFRPSYIDPPPVFDHQFVMTRDEFLASKPKPVSITLAPEVGGPA